MTHTTRRRTPQEKKTLSLTRDRRNAYGENDKASRRCIPANKRRVNRVNRRVERHHLSVALHGDEEIRDRAEQRLLAHTRETWRKAADLPLGEYQARQRNRRVQRHEWHLFEQYVHGQRAVPDDLDAQTAHAVGLFQNLWALHSQAQV
ncbi:hypothetical protein [Kineosporia succinea]|uniref:Uncharacterized protein n=1 Tax=Kineosporia succinea TaxID=84632 RepID=A0ABT9P9V6_9ACTN|nr:hypothetical protein [Kineosporia succinea]MDP9829262.1 hypothetical protein [Kineosporia succinea]